MDEKRTHNRRDAAGDERAGLPRSERPMAKTTMELVSDREIVITRTFRAPPRIVFDAWTRPELVKRWWHANRGEMKVVEIDLRVGGKWRYVAIADGGMEVAFHGEYREIVPNERLVSTEAYEGIPDADEHATLNTATFIGDERTTLEILVEAPSKDVRDAIIASGMEAGMQDALTLLEEVAISLR